MASAPEASSRSPPLKPTPPSPHHSPPPPSTLPPHHPPPSSPPPSLPSPPPPLIGKGSTPPQSFPPPDNPTSPGVFVPPPSHQSAPPPTHKSPKSPTHKTHHRSSDTQASSTSNDNLIIGLTVAGFVFLALVTVCITCTWRRKKKQNMAGYYTKPTPGATGGGDYYKNHEHVVQFTRPEMKGIPVGVGGRWGASQQTNTSGHSALPLAFNMTHFSYDELSTATNGFSQSNLIGQGGFGYVHKGILGDGRDVAVKKLKLDSNQGEREFQAEVEIISRVHHRHLVSLVGYCIADAQRMLVYEYVPNNTLDFHLHGEFSGKHGPVMKWETRMRIALGSAKGLAYLHEDCDPRIIHRDIKSSNILLDYNFEAKVADFGLAKMASREDTHVSTRVVGTFGYLAPEYASSGKLTEKSDVFSFGVMLLELLTGRKPIDPARPFLAKALDDQNYNGLIDPRLEGNYEPNEVARMVSCTAASIRYYAKRRPKMSQIVRVLERDGSLDTLNDALTPQRMESTSSVNQSTDTPSSIVHDTMAYNNDMKNFVEMMKSSNKTSEEASS
ncbi:hypothetical protein QVD17_18898 [Tagetes erecta]|uniref:non-specific serine/threonine protein kinase n=1 Tax=Tagetes erecta TaxID=13708 RepID=A0AAD8KIY3_TARER|nr:hypothetical protein QVD17_18898 [Tagetes erecta]